MKVKDIARALEEFAPLQDQEHWDNAGLCVGSPEDEVHRVLVGFDCTRQLVEEAVSLGADMIVTHHPLIFNGLKRIAPDDPVGGAVYMAIRHGIAIYAAHTNADKAQGGVNELMVQRLGLLDAAPLDESRLGFIGRLPEPLGGEAFCALVKERFGLQLLRCSAPVATVRRVATSCGAGAGFAIAFITPIAPEGFMEGDTCDIYRLSADRPELIVSGGDFGVTYVDPYPAIGEFGGHRIVYRTADGDYITAENEIAWLDITAEDGDALNIIYSLIDFEGEQIEFYYDVTHSNTWEKDFKETRYLGGSVTGDWNKAIGRTASLKGSTVTIKDQDTMRKFRRLAAYPGICHIRTVDGSSFKCDIQVSEDRRYDANTIRAEYSLSVTRVDPEEPDGLTYAEWISGEV